MNDDRVGMALLLDEVRLIGANGWPLHLRWSLDYVDGPAGLLEGLRHYVSITGTPHIWKDAVTRAIVRIAAFYELDGFAASTNTTEVGFISPPNGELAVAWKYIVRSTDRLVEMSTSLPADAVLWTPPAKNHLCIATLIKHVLNNMRQDLLAVLCDYPVVRDLAAEFHPYSESELSSLPLVWEAIRKEIFLRLVSLPIERLPALVIHPKRGVLSGHDLLFLVARHSSEHAGQAEIIRDLWRDSKTSNHP